MTVGRRQLTRQEHERLIAETHATLAVANDYNLTRSAELDPKELQQFHDQRDAHAARLDVAALIAGVTDLGERHLREDTYAACPPAYRDRLDALLDSADGQMATVLTTRLEMLANPRERSDDGWGCALGAAAVAGGFFAEGVLGGAAVVAGIVMMCTYC